MVDRLWAQPASGDAGGSIGCAQLYWHKQLQNSRIPPKDDGMKGSYLGPSFTNDTIRKKLNELGAKFEKATNETLVEKTANFIAKGNAVGWFQGKMEFGPRALGARSILGDPRSSTMQKNLNLKVKFRESFRPFAPAVLFEDLPIWFKIKKKKPLYAFSCRS